MDQPITAREDDPPGGGTQHPQWVLAFYQCISQESCESSLAAAFGRVDDIDLFRKWTQFNSLQRSMGVNVDTIQQHTVAPPWPFRHSLRTLVRVGEFLSMFS